MTTEFLVRVPNQAAWARLQRRQRETGVSEIVCAVEPTGSYHQTLATFLERHGTGVVLVSNTVAHHNRPTLDGTWGKPASRGSAEPSSRAQAEAARDEAALGPACVSHADRRPSRP